MGEVSSSAFGRYTLVERIAVGGMAELFLASAPGEHGFQRKVVIKRLLPHLAREPVYTAMFIDEAKLTARLSHPKIAQTYELGRVGGELFIAMEFIEGIDVLAMLREMAWMRRRVDVDHAVWICHEVLDALDFAHNLKDDAGNSLGIVHRDISPSNVLLSRRGDVKLVDFGIARASGPGRHHRTKSGTLKGKYGYMSPEQVIEQPVDARSDLFSVGVVLAEMLCGRRLFAAAAEIDVLLMVRDAKLTRLDQFGGHIPPSLDKILRKALRKDASERWSSAAEMRDALAEWLFEARKRVTPKAIAELVESLHDAAWKRRRQALAESAAEQAAADQSAEQAVERGVGAAPVPAAPPAPAPVDGVPADLSFGDSLPVISIETPDVAVAPPAMAPPVARTDSADLDLETVGGLDLCELGDLDLDLEPSIVHSPALPSAPLLEDSGKVSVAAQATVSAAGFLDTDFGDLAHDIESAVSQLAAPVPAAVTELEQSIRYGSIEDAISSISPVDADASAIDFDDSVVEEQPPRSRPARLPTREEVAAAVRTEPPSLGEIEVPPTEAGDFAHTSPITLMFRLAATRATGLFTAAVGGIKKEVYIRAGVAEYVTSNMASELLGNYLVAQGALSPGELAMALAMMPHYGGKLGDTLVGLGLLKPLEVFRHLTYQVRQKLIDVCTWTKGAYAWYEGKENQRAAFPLDLNPFEVLGAGAMAMRDDTVNGWLHDHASHALVRPRGRPPVELERFEIAGLVALFGRLDGRLTVGQVVTESLEPGAQRRTARMLILLQHCELVRSTRG
ncbi:MAG TPA: serine/threonine-protein kinase [Kofleriaceae bacterium]|nr:serine/threonine-protein kinase [Kofleriaceae bacterium]